MNIGPEFQAKLSDMLEKDEVHMWTEEPLYEELLWKPWVELEESDIMLEQGKCLLLPSAFRKVGHNKSTHRKLKHTGHSNMSKVSIEFPGTLFVFAFLF